MAIELNSKEDLINFLENLATKEELESIKSTLQQPEPTPEPTPDPTPEPEGEKTKVEEPDEIEKMLGL